MGEGAFVQGDKYSSVSVRLSLFLSLFLCDLCDLCEHQWCSVGGSHTGADWDHNTAQALWPREAPKCLKNRLCGESHAAPLPRVSYRFAKELIGIKSNRY